MEALRDWYISLKENSSQRERERERERDGEIEIEKERERERERERKEKQSLFFFFTSFLLTNYNFYLFYSFAHFVKESFKLKKWENY